MDISVGVVYVTPHGLNKLKGKGESILSYVLEKKQQGLDVLIMGDLLHTSMMGEHHYIAGRNLSKGCAK